MGEAGTNSIGWIEVMAAEPGEDSTCGVTAVVAVLVAGPRPGATPRKLRGPRPPAGDATTAAVGIAAANAAALLPTAGAAAGPAPPLAPPMVYTTDGAAIRMPLWLDVVDTVD
jgi:hypothetical protein